MPVIKHNKTRTERRKIRVRIKMRGTQERPRLTVFRSNQHLYVQAVDDVARKTLASANDVSAKATGTKTERAKQVGKALLKQLEKAKVTKLIFDRGSYKYHGRIKAVAETLREGGIEV
jgi:large subunit ribosomal protein L18